MISYQAPHSKTKTHNHRSRFRRFALRRYESFLRNSYQEELSMFARLLTYASQAYSLLSEFFTKHSKTTYTQRSVFSSEVCSSAVRKFPSESSPEELSTFARLLTYASQAYSLLFGGTKVSFVIPTKNN